VKRPASFLMGCVAAVCAVVAMGAYIFRVGGGQALLLAILCTAGLFVLVLGTARR